MEQFQIREMRETDIAQVEAIEREIFSVPWSEKSFLSACTTPENIYLVCLAGEEVAGYCGLWSVLGEGNITNMAVAEKYRRNGVAEALMKEMENLSGVAIPAPIRGIETREIRHKNVCEKDGIADFVKGWLL